jgi:hypothetical protein
MIPKGKTLAEGAGCPVAQRSRRAGAGQGQRRSAAQAARWGRCGRCQQATGNRQQASGRISDPRCPGSPAGIPDLASPV